MDSGQRDRSRPVPVTGARPAAAAVPPPRRCAAPRIERRFRFGDFAGAFAFVSRAADLAEAEGRHPDTAFGWGHATVSLRTRKIGGLHENDFVMAAKLDRLASDAAGAEPRREG